MAGSFSFTLKILKLLMSCSARWMNNLNYNIVFAFEHKTITGMVIKLVLPEETRQSHCTRSEFNKTTPKRAS